MATYTITIDANFENGNKINEVKETNDMDTAVEIFNLYVGLINISRSVISSASLKFYNSMTDETITRSF